jgi:hypothetical protein
MFPAFIVEKKQDAAEIASTPQWSDKVCSKNKRR